jgi:hypothetical protein
VHHFHCWDGNICTLWRPPLKTWIPPLPDPDIKQKNPRGHGYQTRKEIEKPRDRTSKPIRSEIEKYESNEIFVTRPHVNTTRIALYRHWRKKYHKLPQFIEETIESIVEYEFSLVMPKIIFKRGNCFPLRSTWVHFGLFSGVPVAQISSFLSQ